MNTRMTEVRSVPLLPPPSRMFSSARAASGLYVQLHAALLFCGSTRCSWAARPHSTLTADTATALATPLPPPTLTLAPQDEMMIKVFRYLDHLVQMINPQKLLYMAIDGVAPRAKARATSRCAAAASLC